QHEFGHGADRAGRGAGAGPTRARRQRPARRVRRGLHLGLGGAALVALLFPGQGAQFVGMGRDLAERYAAARDAWHEADQALGVELSRIAWEGPEAELTTTHNAQPAILVHSVAAFRAAAESLGDVRFAAG